MSDLDNLEKARIRKANIKKYGHPNPSWLRKIVSKDKWKTGFEL